MTLYGVDLSEYDHAFPDRDFYLIRAGIGKRQDVAAVKWRGMAMAADKPSALYWYVEHGVDPAMQAVLPSAYAKAIFADVEADTTAQEGRAFIAELRRRRPDLVIGRYGPASRILADGPLGEDYDWIAKWPSAGTTPPVGLPSVPFVLWQDWSSNDGSPRPFHSPPLGDSDIWMGSDRQFLDIFGQAIRRTSLVKFVQAYDPPKALAVPVGTQLLTLDGQPYESLNGQPGSVIGLECLGLADAHSGQYVVRVDTGGLYADGQKRPTDLMVSLPGVLPT